ncbi:MAG: OmpA family protein [Polyangiaceae bacterium]|nr:OmpA family protein [Polyangiaceae bacterium]
MLVATALVGCLVGTGQSAQAQSNGNAIPQATNGKGFDTHLFRPAMDSKGFFATNGTSVLGANDFSLGLVLDYGRTLLRVPDNGQNTRYLISHSFQGTFSFNYGIGNLVAVGLSVPVNLMFGEQQTNAQGDPTSPGQWFTGQLDSQSVGFVALHGKIRLLRVERGFGLALAAQVGVPVSSASRNAGADPSVWVWPQLIAEKRFGSVGQFKIGANIGYRAHSPSDTTMTLRDGTFKDGNLATYGLGLSYRFLEHVDVVADTYATYLVGSGSDSKIRASNEVTGGFKIFVERNSYLMIGAGPRYTPGFQTADLRAFVGFIFEPSTGDRDGDGIPDDVDACPDVPGVASSNPAKNGCPELDRDGDGIPDDVDACPDVPGVASSNPAKNGCPELDRDGDGIPDDVDACPDVPGVASSDPAKNGCPESNRGGDSIPDTGKVIIKDKNIIILEKITFKTGSAEILPQSNEILDAVATTLVHHPEFTLVEIAGHADERSSDAYNLKLTQERVNSVKNALVARNVPEDRLRAKGYGEFCPEDPGHNEAAWERNRRVEFKIVRTLDGPTGVELGCPNALKHGVKPDQ